MNFRLPEKLPEGKPIRLIKYPSKEYPHGLGFVRGPPQPDAPRLLTEEEHAKLAPSIILEDQTPVGDQGSFGSCTANCGENALKISTALQTGNYVNGSRMQLYRDERATYTVSGAGVLNTNSNVAGVTVNSWGVYSSPVITNGWVCYGGLDGGLYYVATDGTAAWAGLGLNPVVSSVVANNNTIFVCTCMMGNNEIQIYSLPVDSTTPPTAVGGTVINSPSAYSNGEFSSPAVDANGLAYVTNAGRVELIEYIPDERIYGIAGLCPTDSSWLSTPAVTDDYMAYVAGSNGKVYATTFLGTPQVVWTYATGAAPGGAVIMPTPALINGVVYVGSYDNKVYAINATTGAKIWSFTTGGDVLSRPTISNGVLYVGSYDNNLYALNAATGALLWSYTTGGAVHSSPCVYNGVVYVGSNDGKVYAINATTGAEVWNYETGGAVHSSPAVSDEPLNGVTTTLVYVGSDDGTFYVLDAATGYSVWGVTTCDVGSSIVVTAQCLGTGIIPETQRPYIPQNLDNPVVSRTGAVYANTGSVYASLAPATTIANIQASIAANYPVMIGFDVYYSIYHVGSDGQLRTPHPVALTAYAPVGATTLSVSDTSPFTAPDLVYINSVVAGVSQATIEREIVSIGENTIEITPPLPSGWFLTQGYTTTDSNGNYQFNEVGYGSGSSYYHRTIYDGDATHSSAMSNTVQITCPSSTLEEEPLEPTTTTTSQLTLAASTNTPAVAAAYTLSGTLKDQSSAPIAGATVLLQLGMIQPFGGAVAWGTMSVNIEECIIGGHGVCIIGYDNTHTCHDGTTGAFWVKNSWGTGWGAPGGISPAGYFWLPYNYFSVPTGTDMDTGAITGYAVGEAWNVNAVAPAVPTPPPTHLALTTSASDPDISNVNQTFTLSGTLFADNVTPIAGMTVTLQSSVNPADNTLWNTIASVASDTNGNYTFSHSESVIGAYYYQTTCAGNIDYASSVSNMIYVGLVSSTAPAPPSPVSPIVTTLTISAPSSAYVNQPITITGTLTNSYGIGVSAQTIQLQDSTDDATWNNVTTAVTDTGGNYTFSHVESAATVYYYQTIYTGSAAYADSTSPSVAVSFSVPPLSTLAPTAVFATTCGQTSSAVAAGARIMVGASDGVNYGVVAETGKGGVTISGGTPTVEYNYNNTTSAIILSNNDTGTSECAATMGNFAAGSFDIVWGTDTKTDSTLINYIAFSSPLPGASVQWSQTTVPTTTSAAIALVGEYAYEGIQITPTIIPTSSSTSYSPTDSFTSSWTQTTVPGAMSPVYPPHVYISRQWSQSTVPNTSSGTVALTGEYAGVTWAQTTTPGTISTVYTPAPSTTGNVLWQQVMVPDTTIDVSTLLVGPGGLQETTPTTTSESIVPTFIITDEDGAIVTNCIVEFINWPVSSLVIEGAT
jgi:outer membrane protein assembly factor BamB